MNVRLCSNLSKFIDSTWHTTCLGKIRIYDSVPLILQIIKWHGSNDYRSFFIIENQSEHFLWLKQEDIDVLSCFSSHIRVFSNDTFDVMLPTEVITASSRNLPPLLIEAVPRGPFSFHFGHFILDTLPLLAICKDIINPSNIPYKLLSVAHHPLLFLIH